MILSVAGAEIVLPQILLASLYFRGLDSNIVAFAGDEAIIDVCFV